MLHRILCWRIGFVSLSAFLPDTVIEAEAFCEDNVLKDWVPRFSAASPLLLALSTRGSQVAAGFSCFATILVWVTSVIGFLVRITQAAWLWCRCYGLCCLLLFLISCTVGVEQGRQGCIVSFAVVCVGTLGDLLLFLCCCCCHSVNVQTGCYLGSSVVVPILWARVASLCILLFIK